MKEKISGRLILAIFSTLLEEVAIVVIALWGLPQLGVRIPLPGLIAIMVAWAVFSVTIYRIGSSALRKKPVFSLPNMLDGRGKVVSPLNPEGLVRIKSELWVAESTGGKLDTGEDVTVVGQEGLKLVVRKTDSGDSIKTNDK